MSHEIIPVTQLKINITSDNDKGSTSYSLDMSSNVFNTLMFLFGNPACNKVERIKLLRQLTNIGLRDALLTVEEAEASHSYDYWHMRRAPEQNAQED